jgi:hypothetical protein
MLVFGGKGRGPALFGLLVEKTHVIHGGRKASHRARFRYLSDLVGRLE